MTLKVCAKCGWYDGYTHAHECDPLAGKRADALANACGITVGSTKLGYGFGVLAFKYDDDDDLNLRFRVSGNKRDSARPYRFEELFLLGDLSREDAIDLVQTIRAWRIRQVVRSK